MEKDAILAAYDAVAPIYQTYASSKNLYIDGVDAIIAPYLKPGLRLLDVGTADGCRLAKLTDGKQLQEVVAIEPSKEMVACCNKHPFPVHHVAAENMASLDLGQFDVVLCLWNVLGHIVDNKTRLQALSNMAQKLRPNGKLIIDVQNRHNAKAYGRFNVAARRLIDCLAFSEHRGNAYYKWDIAGKKYDSSGHLFTPKEVTELFRNAGLKITSQYSVDYQTGKRSASPFAGNLCYILGK